jgi:hypothetical protein
MHLKTRRGGGWKVFKNQQTNSHYIIFLKVGISTAALQLLFCLFLAQTFSIKTHIDFISFTNLFTICTKMKSKVLN